MKNKFKKYIKFITIPILLGIIIGVMAAFMDLKIEKSIFLTFLSPSYIFIYFIFFIFTYIITVIIHELGHLFLGLLTGYKFLSFMILGQVVVKTPSGLKLKKLKIPFAAGQCLMAPPKNKKEYNAFLYNFGGVFFNFISSLLAIFLVFSTNNNLLMVLYIFIFIINLLFALLNWKKSLIPSDGYNYNIIKNSPISKDIFWEGLYINYQQSLNKDVDQSLLTDLDDIYDRNNITVLIPLFYFNEYIENKKYIKAISLAEDILMNWDIIDYYKIEIEWELLYIYLLLYIDSGNKEELEKAYSIARKLDVNYLKKTYKIPSHSRFLYAYYKYIDVNNEAYNKYKKTFAKYNKNFPNEYAVYLENQLINRI